MQEVKFLNLGDFYGKCYLDFNLFLESFEGDYLEYVEVYRFASRLQFIEEKIDRYSVFLLNVELDFVPSVTPEVDHPANRGGDDQIFDLQNFIGGDGEKSKVYTKLFNRIIGYLEGKKVHEEKNAFVKIEESEPVKLTQMDAIRLLYETGVIQFLEERYPRKLKGNPYQIAWLLSKLIDRKHQTLQRYVGALYTENKRDKNYPKSTTSVKAVMLELEEEDN